MSELADFAKAYQLLAPAYKCEEGECSFYSEGFAEFKNAMIKRGHVQPPLSKMLGQPQPTAQGTGMNKKPLKPSCPKKITDDEFVVVPHNKETDKFKVEESGFTKLQNKILHSSIMDLEFETLGS